MDSPIKIEQRLYGIWPGHCQACTISHQTTTTTVKTYSRYWPGLLGLWILWTFSLGTTSNSASSSCKRRSKVLALHVSTGQNSVNIICVSLCCGLAMFPSFCSFCCFISHNKVTIVCVSSFFSLVLLPSYHSFSFTSSVSFGIFILQDVRAKMLTLLHPLHFILNF